MDREVINLDPPKNLLVSALTESGIGDFLEVSYVANVVLSQLRNAIDIIPMVSEHQGEELAARCLVSLGFFRERMNHLTDYHGDPAPKFYMAVGKKEFSRAGRFQVAGHLEDWTDFMHERFKVKEEPKKVESAKVYEKIISRRVFPNSLAWKRTGPLSTGYSLGDNLNDVSGAAGVSNN